MLSSYFKLLMSIFVTFLLLLMLSLKIMSCYCFFSVIDVFLFCFAVQTSVLLSHQRVGGQRGSRGLWEDSGGVFPEERGGLFGPSSQIVSGETTHTSTFHLISPA